MAFTATGVDPSGSNVTFDVTVIINNITRVVSVSIDDLTGPPMALMEFDPAIKTILRGAWYGSTGTPAQRIAALKSGINLSTATLKIRDFINGVDITS